MPHRAVLFDLDGTLIDSLADISAAANAVLEPLGVPAHPAADYKRFIGDGVATLFRRALPEDRVEPDLIDRCVASFGATYERTWNVRSRLYDGIPELLDALVGRRLALAVLSNKPDAFTRKCVEHYLSAWPFPVVFGERAGVPRKPDPAGAIEVANRLEIPAGQFLYVGDTSVDMETARRAGMTPIGVSWGFRPESELHAAGAVAVVDRPIELLEWIEGA